MIHKGMSKPIEGHGVHLCQRIDTKNIDLTEDIENLLPFGFRQIPFIVAEN